MDEKMLTSIEACKMLRASSTVLDNNSKQYSYIPLVNLRKKETKCKEYLQHLMDSLNNLNFSIDFGQHIEFQMHSSSSNISDNPSEKTKAHSNSQKKESRNDCQVINEFIPPPQNSGRQIRAIKKWIADDYTKAVKGIYTSIKYSYSKVLVVWCPTLDVECEFVHAWLRKSAVYVYDRWILKDMHSATDAWGGVVAVYPNATAAKKAAEEIPQQHELLKTITLSNIIQCFVKSELKYFPKEKAKVLVYAKVSSRENVQRIESMLYKFGEVEFCGYDYLIRNGAVQFRVTYSYATHAFLAKTVLDNLPFGPGLLDVEIKKTPKLKTILDDFHCRLKRFIGKVRFPF